MVLFQLPSNMTSEDLVAHSKITAEHWKANDQLLHKTYLYEPDTRQAGALFLWKTREAAEKAHGDSWRKQVISFYGVEPNVRLYESPIAISSGNIILGS